MQSIRNYAAGAVGAALFIALGTLLNRSAVTAATPAKSSAPSRQYYLTKASFTGAEALNQCATGYHFASVAEMNDLSNLTYNTTLGRSAEDGAGPPSLDLGIGWLQSGYTANAVVADSERLPGLLHQPTVISGRVRATLIRASLGLPIRTTILVFSSAPRIVTAEGCQWASGACKTERLQNQPRVRLGERARSNYPSYYTSADYSQTCTSRLLEA